MSTRRQTAIEGEEDSPRSTAGPGSCCLEGDDDGIVFEVRIDREAVSRSAEGSMERADVVRVRHGEHLVLEG